MNIMNLKYTIKKNIKSENGVTLVGLVVTIIILLILAGISISLTIGDTSIFAQAQKAKEEMKIAEYGEFINLAQTQENMDDYKNELTAIEKLEKIKEILQNDSNFEGSTFRIQIYEEKDSLIIITKEGYVFVVTQVDYRYIGKEDITNIPDMKFGDITFACIPSEEYTNQNVEVTMRIENEKYKDYKIEYSYDLNHWTLYKGMPVVVTENNTTIYARGTNEIVSSEEIGGQITILNIDKEAPEINELMQSEVKWNEGIGNVTITAKVIDVLAGIDAYQFSLDPNLNAESEGWEEITPTKENITVQKDVSTNTTYYFYVKDQADNISKKDISISTIKDVTEPIISLTASTTQWTNSDVILTAKAQDVETGIVKYAWTDTANSPTTWNSISTTSEIEQKLTMIENGTKYFWTCDNAGNEDNASLTISNIDKQAPTASINFTSNSISGTNFTVTAKITQEDANSSIDFSNTKWVYNTSSSNIGNISGYTGGTFSSNTQSINLTSTSVGTYYLHVLTTDKAGNQKETVSSPIKITANYHTHSGNSTSGGGCYGKLNTVYHTHSGNSTSGGGCYGQLNTVYHTHSGNSTSGGGCYGKLNTVYHTHSGNSTSGGGCYGKLNTVYHTHSGNSTSGGGCYGQLNTVYHRHTSSCNSSVKCSGLMVQSHVDDQGNTHLSCNSCGRQTTNVVPGSACGATVTKRTCGKTTSTIESQYYSLNCGKTTSTVESQYYSLSCGKTTSTIESQYYSLSCGKTTSTIESQSYSLNCGKTTSTVESQYYSLSCGKTTSTIDSYNITY